MQVLKFGGSSVGSAERIRSVMNIIKARLERGRMVVVVSAVGGATDRIIQVAKKAEAGDKSFSTDLENLLEMHSDIASELCQPVLEEMKNQLDEWKSKLRDVTRGVFLVRELSPRTLDYLMSFGERLSALIMAHALRAVHVQASFVDARGLITTDDGFGNAKVLREQSYSQIQSYFSQNQQSLSVVTGFIAQTVNGITTTLGRGGSDFTASLIGAALGAPKVEIWTDVEGILSGDPRKISSPFTIPEVTYEEAMELSHFGAKVIHPPTMQPLREKSIPIHILCTMNPEASGTVIKENAASRNGEITGISSIDHVSILRLQGSGMVGVSGISSRLFGSLAAVKVNIIFVSQASSEHTICFAVLPEQQTTAQHAIDKEFGLEMSAGMIDPLIVESNCSLLSIVGENMRNTPGISGRIFSVLGEHGINIIAVAQGSSERNISLAVRRDDEMKALNAIHNRLFWKTRPLNILLAGTGNIGSILLSQLHEQRDYLRERFRVEVRVVALASRTKCLIREEGISLSRWKEDFGQASDVESGFTALKEASQNLRLANVVMVDCTASDRAADYCDFLEHGIPLVTPNKRAQSGSMSVFRDIMTSAARGNVAFLNEASVGAGLPVLNTLDDLILSGDRVQKIEGVLSGTMSFIFNALDAGMTFSEALLKAKEQGFTEPDPRDDLSGMDVARKLLILARNSGLALELEDIEIEALLPAELTTIALVEDFLAELPSFDETMKHKVNSAKSRDMKIRYVAEMNRESAKISLKEVDLYDPLYSLSGSDNMIVFHTERYCEKPLVIRGPGAGGPVTAAGVFADILRARNSLFSRL